ncbi:MAG: glucose 1-dehydrogenase [Deltaproteobacteria bacterium]|nr:MAG: glucose 1-dehydrogenase [Deltaproteobacteria bacterium]
MGEFEGRVVIVTGGGMGIGKSYCQGFAKGGAHVVVADVDEEAANRVAQDVNGLAVQVDVSDEASAKAMAMAAHDRYGQIDILVNNAGLFTAVLPMKPWTEISVDEWDRVMAVNVRGYMLCARAVFPYMKERGWGRIINIGSNTSLSGVPGFLHYVTSKGAIIGLTRALAREIGETGITVNTLTPGLVSTEGVKKHYSEKMLDSRVAARSIKRQQMPEDLVGAVMFLSSEGAGFITGQILNVDGGQIMH